MYSYNEKDTVGKLVSNFWKISRVLRDTYDGRGSQRRVLTVLLKSGDVITQSALTERLDIQPGSASEVLAKLEGSRRPAGQPPVVDGLHGDTEVLGELLDPDQGLQPQFCGVHAHQVCEPDRAAPRQSEPTTTTPGWAALRTCQCDG